MTYQLLKPTATATLTIVRFRHAAPKITKMLPRPLVRRTFDDVSKPILPREDRSLAANCKKRGVANDAFLEELNSLNPVQQSLARHIKANVLPRYPYIAICQVVNISGRDQRIAEGKMRLDGLHYKVYNNKVMTDVIKGTKYASLEPLFVGANVLILSDRLRLKELQSHIKKLPQLTLLAATADDRILSAIEVEKLASMPDFNETLPARLVVSTRSVPMETTRLLVGQLVTLRGNLLSRLDQLQSEGESNKSS